MYINLRKTLNIPLWCYFACCGVHIWQYDGINSELCSSVYFFHLYSCHFTHLLFYLLHCIIISLLLFLCILWRVRWYRVFLTRLNQIASLLFRADNAAIWKLFPKFESFDFHATCVILSRVRVVKMNSGREELMPRSLPGTTTFRIKFLIIEFLRSSASWASYRAIYSYFMDTLGKVKLLSQGSGEDLGNCCMRRKAEGNSAPDLLHYRGTMVWLFPN